MESISNKTGDSIFTSGVSAIPKEVTENEIAMRIGQSMYRFITEVDTIQSAIGRTSPGSPGGPKYFITKGMQIDIYGNPTQILGDSSISLDASRKFRPAFRKSPVTLMNNYLKEVKSSENLFELEKRLADIETNKLLVFPIKPKTHCIVDVSKRDLLGGKYAGTDTEEKISDEKKRYTSAVESIIWTTDTKTIKLDCMIITDILDATNKRSKIKIEDYGEKLFLADIERGIKSNSAEAHRFIRFSRYGFVKPIKMSKAGTSILIDNCHIYAIIEGQLIPIAYWNSSSKIEEIDKSFKLFKTALYKKLKDNEDYIASHRRFIAPCEVSEYNEIEF